MKSATTITKSNIHLNVVRFMAVVCASFCGPFPIACAGLLDPARFWITGSKDEDPIVTEVPTIDAPVGAVRTLYIWARPGTDNVGNFKTLQNFSLNLVVPQQPVDRLTDPMNKPVAPVVDFLEDIRIHNEFFDAQQRRRFQFVQDSYSAPFGELKLKSNVTEAEKVRGGMRDGIGGTLGSIQGFSGVPTPDPQDSDPVGIGPVCYPGDQFCKMASDERPAWLIAEVSFKSVLPSGTNPYFLQIGSNGMSHWNEASAGTDVVFSLNKESPVYNAGNSSHRQVTFSSSVPRDHDLPDVWINALPAPSTHPGDYSGDGHVGPEDFWIWKQSFGEFVTAGTGADGNGSSSIDAADYTMWRDHQSVSPGDFDRSGEGGAEDYALWNQTFGQLVASGTGADANGNGVIDAADYTIWQDHSVGGFSREYAVWRQTFGESVTPGSEADYSLNGMIDAADYTLIRDRFGANLATDGGFSSVVRASVPEPDSCVISFALLVLMGMRTSFRKLMHYNQ